VVSSFGAVFAPLFGDFFPRFCLFVSVSATFSPHSPTMSKQPLHDFEVVDEKRPVDQMSQTYRPKQRVTTIVTQKGKGKAAKTVRLRIPLPMAPEIKRFFNAEFWSAETIDDATSASFYSVFTNIVQGDQATNRQGSMIRVLKVVLRLYLVPSSSQASATAVTTALVLDNEPAQGQPGFTTVWQGGLATLPAYQCAIPNYDKRSRFRYLRRDHTPMLWTAVNQTGPVVCVRPEFLTIDQPINRTVKYDGTAARPYGGCELELQAWSDISANTPKAYGAIEVFFTDV
jgi:hypothetical protein